ncbi:MAG TPA: tetratricopeptide repeat protein, partial [Chloroflexi bacterium]|nr:tetratricopeptide repeat protein [Chloroflexota bacterium]
CLRQAAHIFQELGDRQRAGETLCALGVFYFKRGRRQEALAAYEAGVLLLEHPTGPQKTLRRLLKLRRRLGIGPFPELPS